MLPAAVLNVLVTANTTQANAALAKTQAQLKSTGAAAAASSSGWTKFAKTGVAAAVVVGAASVKMASDFNQQMTLIETQAGAPRGEIEKLRGKVIELAKASEFGPTELARGLYRVESAGFRSTKAMEVLNAAQKFAAVGQADLEDTTFALVSAMNSGIRGSKNMTKAVGTLNAIIGQGNMRLDDLNGALGTGILASAKAFGLSLGDVGSALAVLTRTGMGARQSATRLRMALFMMGSPSDKAKEALKGIGLEQDTLANDLRKPNGILVAFRDLNEHMKGMSDTAKVQTLGDIFGGGRTASGAITLFQHLKMLGEIQDNVKKKTKSFNDDYAKQAATSSAKFKNAWAIVQSWLVQLGSTLDGPVASALQWTIQQLDSIGRLGPIIGAAFNWIATAARNTAQWVQTAASNFTGFISSLLPVKLAVAELALVFGFLKPPIEFVIGVALQMARVFGSVVVANLRVAWSVIKTVATVTGDVVSVISHLLRGDFAGAWNAAKQIVIDAWTGIKNITRTGFDAVKSVLKSVASAIGNVFAGAWDKVKDIWSNAVDVIKGFIGAIVDVINLLPMVDIKLPWENKGPETGTLKKQRHGGHHFAVGGKVDRPGYFAGEEAPRYPEYIVATNPAYKTRNVGLWQQAGSDLGIPGFADGGIPGGAKSVLKMGAGVVGPAGGLNPADLIGKLPAAPGGVLHDTGEWVLSEVTKWLKDQVTGDLLGVGMNAKAGSDLIVAVGRALQAQGFLVGENPAFGGVSGVHVDNSYHYRGRAIDVNWPNAAQEPAHLRPLYDQLARSKTRPTELFYQNRGIPGPVANHWDHLHLAYKEGGVNAAIRQIRNKGTRFMSTAYGPPWGGIQGTGETSTGIDLRKNPHRFLIATDPATIPTHSKVNVWPNPFNTLSPFAAEDTGGAIKGNRLDFYDWRGRGRQNRWGRKTVSVLKGGLTGKAAEGAAGTAPTGGQAEISKKLAKKLRGMGLKPSVQKLIDSYTTQATMYEDFADRASQLESEVYGKGELAWLQDELNTLWQLRNTLIKAHLQLDAKLKNLRKMVRKAASKPAVKAIKDQIKASQESDANVISALDEVQGKVPDSIRYAVGSNFPVGAIGGSIFDVQMKMKDAGGTPAAAKGLSAETLREIGYLKTLGVQFNPASFQGMFASGGVLGAGNWGIAGERGPEAVVGPAAIVPRGAVSTVRVIVEDNRTIVEQDGRVVEEIAHKVMDQRDRAASNRYRMG